MIIDDIRTPRDVGQTIRVLRQSKKMTGLELAEHAGLSQSKVSKIETGVTRPSRKELENILNILKCSKTIRQRILTVFEVETELPSSKYRPISEKPNELLKRERATTYLRCCVFSIVPALLQTVAYRDSLLSRSKLPPKELAHRMQETVRRQDLLWDKKRSFHFVIHEAALYTQPGSRETQRAQLDRIERFCGLRHIKIGIIPVEAGLPTVETASSFVLYDNRLLVHVLGHRQLTTEDPEDIAEHIKLFGELDEKACYDNEAKDIIHRAVRFFE